MSFRENISEKAAPRKLPQLEEAVRSMEAAYLEEPPPVTLTISLKLHNPSSKKAHQLLAAHRYVTTVIAKILDHYREDPKKLRDDGAIARVLSIQGQSSGRARQLANTIYKEYLAPHLTDEDYRYSSRLREGACREAARMLVLWVQDIIDLMQKESSPFAGRGVMPDQSSEAIFVQAVQQVYDTWQKSHIKYEQAAAIPIPFGRHKGTPLGKIGKREARWLLERLLPPEEITQTLMYVEELLDERGHLMDEAAFAEHPYKRDDTHRRRIRASRLLHRMLDPVGDLILLGTLHRDELEQLRTELREMRDVAAVFDAELRHLQEALGEMALVGPILKDFQDAFETFLYEKPSAYPTVVVPHTDEERAALQETYETRLDWFSPNPRRPDDAAKYVSTDLETKAVNRLLDVLGQLNPKKQTFQPLPFIGAMRPGASYRDFALLYDRENGEYVLAVALRGRNAPLTDEERQERALNEGLQKRKGNLYYVNFPETPFAPSHRAPLMLFPLEFGKRYHHQRFLQKAIDHQRAAQRDLFEQQSANGSSLVRLEQCLPKDVPICSAKIVVKEHTVGMPEFYLHLHVAMQLPEQQPMPDRVMGVHEHEKGYSYALLSLDGQVLDVGDVAVPPHVDPLLGAKPNSDNYVFEMANAIVKQAAQAYIGLEDTSWKKARADLARERNRATFRRPSRRIAAVVQYKAVLAGSLRPQLISNVSPAYDCGACCHRLAKGTKSLYRQTWLVCPACQGRQSLQQDSPDQVCQRCQHTWALKHDPPFDELFFRCFHCSSLQQLARHNIAIVVAQEALRQIVNGRSRTTRNRKGRVRRPASRSLSSDKLE